MAVGWRQWLARWWGNRKLVPLSDESIAAVDVRWARCMAYALGSLVPRISPQEAFLVLRASLGTHWGWFGEQGRCEVRQALAEGIDYGYHLVVVPACDWLEREAAIREEQKDLELLHAEPSTNDGGSLMLLVFQRRHAR